MLFGVSLQEGTFNFLRTNFTWAGGGIQAGPLCGMEAVFVKKLDGTSRTMLLLKAISFQVRVNIEFRRVAKYVKLLVMNALTC